MYPISQDVHRLHSTITRCLFQKCNHSGTLNGDTISYNTVPTDPRAILSHVECMSTAVVPHKSRMTRTNEITMVIVYAVESLAELTERITLINNKIELSLRSGAFPVARLGAVDSTGRFTPSILHLCLVVTSVARHQ